ncbi:MAG TPA: GNAT family N-acetyltransferase [Actinomycetota bacterium]|jgi:ribosomal protein S18 acetylase RimI-like enzyme
MSATAADVTIRRATERDARAIAEVHVASWRWAYRNDLPASLLADLSVDERELAHRRELAAEEGTTCVLVAVDTGDRVMGFASTGPSRDDDAPPDTGELYAIYLLADVAGSGLGRALLEHATRDLRDAGYVTASLWVLASNERARRFYERAGWRWDGSVSEHRFDCGNRPIVRYSIDGLASSDARG